MIKSISYRHAMGVAVAIVLGPQAFGQVSFSNTSGLAYSQNFNGFATSGSSNGWSDNNNAGLSSGANVASTAGWYVKSAVSGSEFSDNSSNSYTAGDGSISTADLYSYGTGTDSDRALGAYPSNGTGAFYIGLHLRYTGTPDLSQLQVIYRGEVWRDSRDKTSTMTFEYKVSGSTISVSDASGWTSVSSLNFQYTGDSSSGAEDGNAAGNFSQNNALINPTITNGDYIMLRWTVPNTSGADHGFAIDDVFIAVPEAGTWAAGAVLGGMMVTLLGRRREAAKLS